MRKSYAVIWCAVLSITLLASGCKKKVKPLSERIAKTWTAESVDHATTVVYTRGGSANSWPGYSDFRLILTTASGVNSATLTEWNKDSFTGTWELEGDTKLILKNLVPVPTGTSGTIEFTINSIDDSKLVITRLSTSKKTGDTINKYTLSNP
ncbi:hypothetical protein DYBT9275_04457 [Dyadobacter sp. CECT 9275]|uniref:Lipocalin-like domain-containing protein n=1 Tax=Dyadobacter helix TaxID=2822344 RepID=A0A916JJ43_9BACT|nr:hypothetical protein [Dyadobacter sp. CECT 9275]CAG5009263.1 hypothetical protein DYBT9275_04457 [Dyadobacter sp. CECT 9275]